ncbi:spore coat protein U domain-containing protein [Aeromonas veronii]|uniref:spore coat protein U domain-containing protein n=1 Tax=Aeromonas TaxID=642 RepID=UPI001D0B7B39|nr:spore coat protein U domain-containing protein [Aeromonas veronii]UDN23626.1 spore coat protein U domain-containing protein [Aeromonas veronii]
MKIDCNVVLKALLVLVAFPAGGAFAGQATPQIKVEIKVLPSTPACSVNTNDINFTHDKVLAAFDGNEVKEKTVLNLQCTGGTSVNVASIKLSGGNSDVSSDPYCRRVPLMNNTQQYFSALMQINDGYRLVSLCHNSEISMNGLVVYPDTKFDLYTQLFPLPGKNASNTPEGQYKSANLTITMSYS